MGASRSPGSARGAREACAPLLSPSLVLGCLCPIRWARVERRKRQQSRAMRAAISPARLVREWGGRARYARWAVCLEQTLGFPSSQHPWVRAPPRWGSQTGPPGHLGAPRHSDLPCLPQPYRAAELPRRWRGQCPRGGRPLARAARPPAPAVWLGPVADHPPLASGRCPRTRPPAAGRFSSWPSSCRRRCSGGLNLLAPFPPPGSAPCARKVEFRGFKLLIGISHCCVTRGGGDTHAAHSHTLTLAATSGSGLKGEAALPCPRPRQP